MGRLCKGYCRDYTCHRIPNGEKYQHCKRCTYCGLFLKTSEVRCPCCGAILRTKPRTKKPSSKRFDKIKSKSDEKRDIITSIENKPEKNQLIRNLNTA